MSNASTYPMSGGPAAVSIASPAAIVRELLPTLAERAEHFDETDRFVAEN